MKYHGKGHNSLPEAPTEEEMQEHSPITDTKKKKKISGTEGPPGTISGGVGGGTRWTNQLYSIEIRP